MEGCVVAGFTIDSTLSIASTRGFAFDVKAGKRVMVGADIFGRGWSAIASIPFAPQRGTKATSSISITIRNAIPFVETRVF
jgi:hypothetical protein